MHVYVQVQRHLQLRIEAQGKYMQSILEKACQTLAGENNMAAASVGYNIKAMPANNQHQQQGGPNIGGIGGIGDMGGGGIKDFGFPSFQDLNLYGGGGDHHQLDLQQNVDGFITHNDDDDDSRVLCLGKKKPASNRPPGKAHLDWPHDLRLQDIGIAPPSSCVGLGLAHHEDDFKNINIVERDHHHLEEMYEAKAVAASDNNNNNNNDANNNNNNPNVTSSLLKLQRPSPRRALSTDAPNNHPLTTHSPFG